MRSRYAGCGPDLCPPASSTPHNHGHGKGAPGTGKSTTLTVPAQCYLQAGNNVIAAATAWKFAKGLGAGLGVETKATAARLAALRRGEKVFDQNTLAALKRGNATIDKPPLCDVRSGGRPYGRGLGR